MHTHRIVHTLLHGRVEIIVGDITVMNSDAIVNAANSSLFGGGGVDGAIHRAAGSALLAACRKIRAVQYPDGLPAGRAVLTEAGNLHARFVIHTVGPVYRPGDPQCPLLLASCYAESLLLAGEAGCDSIAFPAVSTGVYGYPKEEAALIAWHEVEKHAASGRPPHKVYLVFFSESDAFIFLRAIGQS